MRALVLLAAALTTPACSSPRPAGQVHRVTITGMQFDPEVVTARAGDTVVWTNHDIVPHTATAAGAFDSGTLASQAEWRLVVTARGTIPYACALHPTMKGTLLVR
jgi:plastocyanin